MSQQPTALKNGRPTLRIVRSDETPAVDAAKTDDAAAKPKPKSKLGAFMTAFADSIDRDVQRVLEL